MNLPEGGNCLLLHHKYLSLKRFKKILKWFFLSLLLLIVAAYIFIQTPFGQNWIGRQVTKRLSRGLQTKVTVKHIDFSLLNKMHLEGLMVEDQHGDTLLFAGDLKVRITDWFFFKKNITLKYIGLEDALVKFQRTDSVWSQQFLFDYFSSPSASSSKKTGGTQINLKKLELKNVTFLKIDKWMGEDLTATIGALTADADQLNLSGKNFKINSLIVSNPVVAINKYSRLKPKRINTTTDIDPDKTVSTNSSPVFQIGEIKIINGTLKIDKQNNRSPLSWFDGQHILFTGINAGLNSSLFNGDTILSKLKLTAKERSGLEVKSFTADVKMTPQEMAFNNLDIITNNSHIQNYFRMSYDKFSDMNDFISSVIMQADFDEAEIDTDDIAFFAPSLTRWKKKITMNGKVRGTVDGLTGRDLVIHAGNNTMLNGDISLTGLPFIEQTFIDLKANDFRTTYGDAVTIFPAIKRVTIPDIRKIQYVQFKGNFTGFIRDFVTFGTLQTNLGIVKTDLNMKLPPGQQPVYSGNISTENFRLGDFLGDKNIGIVSMDATVKGTGLSATTRNTLIDGKIRFADYKNYRYNNITAKGKLNKEIFEGTASIHDENADLRLNGIINFNKSDPMFNLKADVLKANLKNLNLTRDDFSFSSKLDINFKGNTIDNFLGHAYITDAEIAKNGERLPFDSLVLSSSYADHEKIITAVSNEFNATVRGDFSLKELPDAFTYLLNKYYPSYIKAPAQIPRNQHIRFDIAAYYADEYLKLIDSGMSGFNDSRFKGSLSIDNQHVNLILDLIDIPQFKFKQYDFDKVQLKVAGNNDSLIVTGGVKNITINDSVNISQASFKINARNDSSQISIKTGNTEAVEKASINALVLTYNDGVKIEFEPSNFTINGKTWIIDENGELEFRSSSPAKGQLVMHEG
ncbi:MAG: translocation/assembly module TamB domain-containing protein, partial [Chitinophagaceae bacterium]